MNILERLRSSREWLNGGECCGDKDSEGICAAPACVFGEALKELYAAADEIEKLRAALTIPKRTLELFERVASEMVSEGYAQGYREACNHIMHYMMHDTMDKLGEK